MAFRANLVPFFVLREVALLREGLATSGERAHERALIGVNAGMILGITQLVKCLALLQLSAALAEIFLVLAFCLSVRDHAAAQHSSVLGRNRVCGDPLIR